MSEAKVAIITGASSGVGRETARLLAQEGYAVVLVGRNVRDLRKTEKLIGENGLEHARVLTIAADIGEPAQVRKIVEQTLQTFGRIDALANVAGFAPRQPIDEVTAELWRQTIDVNLSGPVLLTTAVWPTFRAQGSGVIVNVSSLASVDPFPGFSIYAAAKVGLNVFTKCTADEGRKIGVRAVAIAPGAIETRMLRQAFDETMIPRDKTLTPAAVAAVIRDCITGARTFKPGEVILLPSP